MSQTANRYSKAIFDLAQEQKILEDVQASMSEIRKLILSLENFRNFLTNPLLSYEERTSTLKALFEGKVPDLVFRFLIFVTYKGRLDILKDMIESFDDMYLVHTHQMRVYVKTALPINDDEKAVIDQHLQNKFKQQMITRWSVDPSLVGGFRIFAQGKLYDYSFKNQLSHFSLESTQPV